MVRFKKLTFHNITKYSELSNFMNIISIEIEKITYDCFDYYLREHIICGEYFLLTFSFDI